jgi:hypothetical protein
MAILQVREIDDRLYKSLKELAKSENRSLSQEIIFILEKYMANPSLFEGNITRNFLALSESWDDDRSAEEIVADIKNNIKNSDRFGANNVLFD